MLITSFLKILYIKKIKGVRKMKLTIEGNTEEIKNVFQAIGGSKEHIQENQYLSIGITRCYPITVEPKILAIRASN
jgi:hypothetical protein